jgi:hypothetical protein
VGFRERGCPRRIVKSKRKRPHSFLNVAFFKPATTYSPLVWRGRPRPRKLKSAHFHLHMFIRHRQKSHPELGCVTTLRTEAYNPTPPIYVFQFRHSRQVSVSSPAPPSAEGGCGFVHHFLHWGEKHLADSSSRYCADKLLARRRHFKPSRATAHAPQGPISREPNREFICMQSWSCLIMFIYSSCLFEIRTAGLFQS